MQYLLNGFFPLTAPYNTLVIWNGKVQPELWPEIVEQSKVNTYRELDRAFRSGKHMHDHLYAWDTLGIGFKSLGEQFDTSTTPGEIATESAGRLG